HHGEASGGMKLLDAVAGMVNSLGDVRWIGMKEIARSNYYKRVRDGVLEVYSCSRLIEIDVPEGVRTVWVDGPAFNGALLKASGVGAGQKQDVGLEIGADGIIPMKGTARLTVTA